MFTNEKMNITINWQEIGSEEQFYNQFLPQVQAPEWHGRNLNALTDSIVTGDINKIEPPFTIISKNSDNIPSSLKEFQDTVFEIFNEAIEAKRDIKVVKQ